MNMGCYNKCGIVGGNTKNGDYSIQITPDVDSYLVTFRSGGSSGYFSVCEKIKPNWTASKKVSLSRDLKCTELGHNQTEDKWKQ